MPEYNFTFNWARITTLGKVQNVLMPIVGAPSQAQVTQAVADYIEAHPGSLSPLSAATKAALLQIAEKVAYIDENGESYYNALDAALNARALLQITAVYTQSGTVYTTDSLDSLKADLVVTAYYDDGTTADVTAAATLSGTLTVGTSTITATYSGKTATFTVTVSLKWRYELSDGTLINGGYADNAGADSGMRVGAWDSNRKSVALANGEAQIAIENPQGTFQQDSGYYPISAPVGATSVKVTITPSTQYVQVLTRQLVNGKYTAYTTQGQTGYQQGTITKTFEPHIDRLYFFVTSKYNSAGTSYPTLPSNIVVEFGHD